MATDENKDEGQPVEEATPLELNAKRRADIEEKFKESGGQTQSMAGMVSGSAADGLLDAAQAIAPKLREGKAVVAFVGWIGLPGETSADCGLEIVSLPLSPLNLMFLINGNVAGQVADNLFASLSEGFDRLVKQELLHQTLRNAKLDPEKGN